MLDEFRSTYIAWDKATRRIYSPISANESDSNGRKLNIQVVNSGQVENLTGATLHLYWETKDKAQHGLDAFTASDITKGEFEIFYTTGMLSNVGELNATLVLVDATGQVVSDWFKITVVRGIDGDAIQSENSFTTLTQALIDISNLEQNYAPRLNDLTAQLQQTEQEFSSRLAQNIERLKFRKPISFGEIILPSWINTKGLQFFRDITGVAKSNFVVNRYKNLSFTDTYYVHTETGNYTASGTQADPFKNVGLAIAKANATTGRAFKIIVKGKHFRREMFNSEGGDNWGKITNKDIVIVPRDDEDLIFSNANSNSRDGGYISNSNAPLAWTKVGNHYETNRTQTVGVSDLNNKDFYGIGRPLTMRNSVAEVDANPNSFYTDGTKVYVRTADNRLPDDNLLVLLRDHGFQYELVNSTLYMERPAFYYGANQFNEIDGAGFFKGDVNSKLILFRPKASGGNINSLSSFTNIFTNGISFKDFGEAYIINPTVGYTRRDGINGHWAGTAPSQIKDCLMYVENAIGYDVGLGDSSSNNNISTAHEGVHHIELNTIGMRARGPMIADVQGCKTVLIDCHVRENTLKNGTVNDAGFSFKDEGNPAGEKGKALLINCTSKECHYSISGEPGFDVAVETFYDYDKIDNSMSVVAL